MTTVVTTGALLTEFLAFALAADVIITRSNLRQRDRQMGAAKLEYLQESRRRIVAVEEGVRKDIALQLQGSVQNMVVLLLHRLKDLEQATPPAPAGPLADLQHDYGEALSDHIRSITDRLYPSILCYSLVPALQALADALQATLGTLTWNSTRRSSRAKKRTRA